MLSGPGLIEDVVVLIPAGSGDSQCALLADPVAGRIVQSDPHPARVVAEVDETDVGAELVVVGELRQQARLTREE